MNEVSGTEIIKSDRRGRSRYAEEFKTKVLDAFERSGMTGMQFAQQCGVKYPTFATWVKKRREGGGSGAEPPKPIANEAFLIAEISEDDLGAGLSVTLPGGAVAQATSREQVLLLAELLNALPQERC